jgi:hypothetical protein
MNRISRTEWIVQFESIVLAKAPQLAGRIEWAIPNHAYLQGKSPALAARNYLVVAAASAQLVAGGIYRQAA